METTITTSVKLTLTLPCDLNDAIEKAYVAAIARQVLTDDRPLMTKAEFIRTTLQKGLTL